MINHIDKTWYHRVVSLGVGPAIHKTADVSIHGVDVRSISVNVVHETSYRFAFRGQTVNPNWARVSYLITVGVMTGQIDQEIGMVPFLQFANKNRIVL